MIRWTLRGGGNMIETRLVMFLVSILVLSAVYAQAAAPEEKKQDLIRQMKEVNNLLFELKINGSTENTVYFNLSTGEEWVATRMFENGQYVYSAIPVKPEETELNAVSAVAEPEPPKASQSEIAAIGEEELNLALEKANKLWASRLNDKDSEIFSVPPFEKQWKMVPLKGEAGMVYALFRQGISGEIIRGPREAKKAEAQSTQATIEKPESPAAPSPAIKPKSDVASGSSDAKKTPAADERGTTETGQGVAKVPEKPEMPKPVVKEKSGEKNGSVMKKILKWLFRR